MEIKKIAVIGAGTMGKQIALNAAIFNYEVVLTDHSKEYLDKAEEWAKGYLNGRLEKGKMTDSDVKSALNNLKFVYEFEKSLDGADLIIEAIIEDRKIKEELFKKISSIVGEKVIIASNSSYMPSSLFKDNVNNPGRLANLHYFNPAMVMELVEVVKGEHTSLDTINTLKEFVLSVKKIPVILNKEIDGFIVNRILRALMNEAMYILEEEVATPQDIDTAIQKGLNHPLGPFKLMDLIGIDISYLAAKRVFEEEGYKKPGYDILEKMYNDKTHGKKTGKGWYTY